MCLPLGEGLILFIYLLCASDIIRIVKSQLQLSRHYWKPLWWERMSLRRNIVNPLEFFFFFFLVLFSSKPPCPLKGRKVPDKKKKKKNNGKHRGKYQQGRRKFQSDYQGGKAARDTNSRKTLAWTCRSFSPSTRKLMMLARRWITSDSTQSGSDKWAPASLTPASTWGKTNSHVSCYL